MNCLLPHHAQELARYTPVPFSQMYSQRNTCKTSGRILEHYDSGEPFHRCSQQDQPTTPGTRTNHNANHHELICLWPCYLVKSQYCKYAHCPPRAHTGWRYSEPFYSAATLPENNESRNTIDLEPGTRHAHTNPPMPETVLELV